MTTLKVRPGLKLRTWTPDDAKELFELIDKNRKHLHPWFAWVVKTKKTSDISKFIKDVLKKKVEEFGIWHQNKLIGSIAFNSVNKQNLKADIGYWLSKDFTGQGIMTDCVRAIISWGFLKKKLNRIVISCSPNNLQSNNIAKRIGFHFEGISRQNEYLNGKFLDSNNYSLLKIDWLKQKKQNDLRY